MYDVVIIGAGPAGLTAGYLLSKAGRSVVVLEADPEYVGGISRTVLYNGYRFDIGGHRFFSKSQEVVDLWNEILPDDFIDRPRSSRIYYKGKFYTYPLQGLEALRKLGVFEAVRCVLSYARARLFPISNPDNYEDWVVNKFGRRLFEIFFKTYTEKVWGMKCTEISADWAAQRISGFSLSAAIRSMIPLFRSRATNAKTLISSFRYPRKGPGMMWEKARDRIVAHGGEVLMGENVVGMRYDPATKGWVCSSRNENGGVTEWLSMHVISTAPLREVAEMLGLSENGATKATLLRYRDFITVALIVKKSDAFFDQWIYIHDPSIRAGRIQNFGMWSPEMIPDESTTCYGLEYFCNEDDTLWNKPDEELKEIAVREMCALGLVGEQDVFDAAVVRQRKAYPVYDQTYQDAVASIRSAFEERYPNLHPVGRNGMHKYNNQDHSMMTAMLTVRNILSDHQKYDVWSVNEDAEYHEDGEHAALQSLRAVPLAR